MRRVASTFGVALGVCVLAAAVAPHPARASELIGRNATGVRLQVDAAGRALVSFRSDGRAKTVVAWGAVDARPPSRARAQVAFSLALGGGIGPNVCRSYRGPALPWRVAACTAPDGTHWAVQSWQRMLPDYGAPAAGERAAWELRLSHWSGELPKLELWADWSYRRFQHLYGRLSYKGSPVFGFRSSGTGAPLDAYGRNVYLDSLDSDYGRGWKRVNSFLAHNPGGTFCYGFYPHGRGTGTGRRYRATVIGPGVAPDVMWEGVAPGQFDPIRDAQANDRQRAVLGGDRLCKIN